MNISEIKAIIESSHSAVRDLRSRLYTMGLQAENIDREVSVTDLPGDTTCPNDLGEFRAFNND